MNKESVVAALESQLRIYADAGDALRREPARSDFFRVFAAAFNAGWLDSASYQPLTPDFLDEHFRHNAPELAASDAWREVRICWREWSYAWQRSFMRAVDGPAGPPGSGKPH